MNSKEMFGLFVRVIGVLGIAFIVHHVGGDMKAGVKLLNVDYIAKKALLALVGIYFVKGAPHLVKFAYCEGSCGKTDKP
jgi:hypothetical protein